MLRDSLKWRTENKMDTIRCDEVESQIVMGRIFNQFYSIFYYFFSVGSCLPLCSFLFFLFFFLSFLAFFFV